MSQRLLEGLRQEGEELSAATHVEVEIIEDVTNILKTYVIGETAEDYLTEQPAIEPAVVEETVDRTPPPQQKVERIYVDVLEKEEEEMEHAKVRLSMEGQHLEGQGSLQRIRRLQTEDSVDVTTPRCAHTFVDCDLVRREDRSDYLVRIAMPLVTAINVILTQTRRKAKAQKSALAMEREGLRYQQEQELRSIRRLETSDSVEEEVATRREETVLEERAMERVEEKVIEMKATERVVEKRQEELLEREAEGGSYEMERDGQKFLGEMAIRRKHRELSSASEEEERLREAEGGQYGFEKEGLDLRGHVKMRRQGRMYESESEESWGGGGPTMVDLVQKESHSHFDVVFETANNATPVLVTIFPPVKKRETAEVTCSLSKAETSRAETSTLRADKTTWTETYNGRELAEEYANVAIGLQNLSDGSKFKQDAERNMAGKSLEKISRRIKEAREEQAVMMYGFANTRTSQAEAETRRREKQIQKLTFFGAAAEENQVQLTNQMCRSGEVQRSQGTCRMPRTTQAMARFAESASESLTSVLYLQKEKGVGGLQAEKIARAVDRRAAAFHARASQETSTSTTQVIHRSASYPETMAAGKLLWSHNVSEARFACSESELHSASTSTAFDRGLMTATASVTRKDSHKQKLVGRVTEFGDAQESCAVLLKNAGTLMDGAYAAVAETVSGKFDTLTVSKNWHLPCFRNILPARGSARLCLPLAAHAAASFRLSGLSEHSPPLTIEITPLLLHDKLSNLGE